MNYRFKNQVSRFLSHLHIVSTLQPFVWLYTFGSKHTHCQKKNKKNPETISFVSCSLVFASNCPPIFLGFFVVFFLSKRTVPRHRDRWEFCLEFWKTTVWTLPLIWEDLPSRVCLLPGPQSGLGDKWMGLFQDRKFTQVSCEQKVCLKCVILIWLPKVWFTVF